MKPYAKQLDLVLLTHIHGDHFNPACIRGIVRENPAVTFLCGEWLVKPLQEAGARNIKTVRIDQTYYEKGVYLAPCHAQHNVPNIGWRMMKGGLKALYITDTCHLDAFVAPNFNLYAIEMNFDEHDVKELIEKEIQEVGFSHRQRSLDDHLSIQRARKFINDNTKGFSDFDVVPLHISSVYKDKFEEMYKNGGRDL